MFLAEETIVAAGFADAAARFAHVISYGSIHAASVAAYEHGQAAVLRVGPAGDMPGLSKLVRVQFLAPVQHGATLTLALRWEATGPAGELFPALDADLVLAREGEDQVRLGLTGSYRPPLGRAGAALDRALLRRITTATACSLLGGLAEAIADPQPEPQPHTGKVRHRPDPKPGRSRPYCAKARRLEQPGASSRGASAA
jgi:hypothetical protein